MPSATSGDSDYAADAHPRCRRTGGLQARHRRPGSMLPLGAERGPVRRNGLHFPQLLAQSGQAPGLRRPGVLALPQTIVLGEISFLAVVRWLECHRLAPPRSAGAALGWKPILNPGGAPVEKAHSPGPADDQPRSSGRSADLIAPPIKNTHLERAHDLHSAR